MYLLVHQNGNKYIQLTTDYIIQGKGTDRDREKEFEQHKKVIYR